MITPRVRLGWALQRPLFGMAVMALGCGNAPRQDASLDESQRLPGGETTNTWLGGSNAFIEHADNILPEHEAAFFAGNGFFNSPWVEAPASTTARDGLGPLFNAVSCSTCHFKDGRGAPPLEENEPFTGLLLRLSVPGTDPTGAPLPEPSYGGQLQPFAIGGVPAEGSPRVVYTERNGAYADGTPYSLLVPEYEIRELAYGALDGDTQVSPRVAPAMIGLGLLEAIEESRLRELADPDDEDENGVSGRLNHVWDVDSSSLRAGRFGWKAEQPSLRQQAAAAFLGDLGMSTPLFAAQDCTEAQPECQRAATGGEPEVTESILDNLERYSQLLSVPVRQNWDDEQVRLGQELFTDAGCHECHTPNHRTGNHALPELSDQSIWPYTDLLLHDMGEDLADDRPVFEASGSEWRTPPLWGLGRLPEINGHDRLLHDGRARGVAEAILWHGGEAKSARTAFVEMNEKQRAALVSFVESL